MVYSVKVLKYVLLVLDVVYGFIGMVVIVLAVAGMYQNVPPEIETSYEIVLALGIHMFLASILGCFAILKEGICLLKTFAAVLFTISIIVALLAAIIFSAKSLIVANPAFEEKLYGEMDKKIFSDKLNADKIQAAFHCCGINGPSFWKSLQLPNSCCKSLANCNVSSSDLYQDGCLAVGKSFLLKTFNAVGGIIVVVALLGFTKAAFSLFLAKSLRRGNRMRSA